MGVNMEVCFYTKEELTEDFIRKILKAVESSGFTYDEFDFIEGKPFGKCVPVPVEKTIQRILKGGKGWDGQSCWEGASFRIKSVEVDSLKWSLTVSMGKDKFDKDYTGLCIFIRTGYLLESNKNEDRLFNVFRNVIKATNPVFGIGGNELTLDDRGDILHLPKYIKKSTMPYIPWTLFLGPDYLKKYGEKMLLKTPALIVEKIGNGIFIVTDYMYKGESPEGDIKPAQYSEKSIGYLKKLLKPKKL